MASNKKDLKQKEKDFKADIAATEKDIEKDMKSYRSAVKALLDADKAYEAAALNAGANPMKFEQAKQKVADAAREYKMLDDAIDASVAALQEKSRFLYCFYNSADKAALASKENARFEKYYAKHNEMMAKAAGNADDIVSSVFEGMRRSVAPVAPVAPVVVPKACDVNVAPIDLDVTDIVKEAVDATMKSFTEALKTKSVDVAPVANDQNKTEALQTIANEQAFVVNKLSELVEGMKNIIDSINALNTKSAEIIEKQKAASEVQNELTKTQRTTMREIQGIQVRQKLVITEQEALVAEQTVAFEHHKLVSEAQKALGEQQQISVDEINALVENQKALNATVKETLDSNKSIVAMAEKTAEAQKNLTEKQQDLIALQKEAMAAHRQVARGQRSAESKRRPAANKAEAVEAVAEPVAEAEVKETVEA